MKHYIACLDANGETLFMYSENGRMYETEDHSAAMKTCGELNEDAMQGITVHPRVVAFEIVSE